VHPVCAHGGAPGFISRSGRGVLMTAPVVVRVDGVSHFFGEGGARNQVLFDNSIAIAAGQLVVMTGPSGSGKTTLLTLIGALRSIQTGRIEVLAQDLSELRSRDLVTIRRNIGFIFQMHNLFDSLSAFENVKMAMQLGACPAREMRRRGSEILERLGLGDRMDYKPKALSGGQRQRVAVARALVNRPRIILADEPTAALDKESSRIVVNLLKQLTMEDGCTVVMVTHDNRILETADRIVNMVDGVIKSDVILHDAMRLCEFLRTIDLFRHLTPTELTHVAEKMKKRRFAPDDVIIRQGDIGEEFFLIGQGTVKVVRRVRPEDDDRHVATLEAGNFFGERALMGGEPRNATVVAASEAEIYALDKEAFREALNSSASFKNQLYRVYFQRQ
jgi:putative ABC transport system ATP-binding protein